MRRPSPPPPLPPARPRATPWPPRARGHAGVRAPRDGSRSVVSKKTYIYIYIYRCVFIFIYIYTYIYIHICICFYMYVYMYTLVYIRIYTYVYEDYAWATLQLQAVANRCCAGRLVSVLEGGYNTRAGSLSPFAQSVASHVRSASASASASAAARPGLGRNRGFWAISAPSLAKIA